ncbi:MAG: hypothetical protein RMX35_14410 [Nostoc sp. DcaGUA01]|nr:hypothetical protein [Nostoc sp. DcaGUA01]
MLAYSSGEASYAKCLVEKLTTGIGIGSQYHTYLAVMEKSDRRKLND